MQIPRFRHPHVPFLTTIMASCILAACGGGGSDTGADVPPLAASSAEGEATLLPGKGGVKGRTSFPLTVSLSGTGNVNSNPAGINCGTDCTETYLSDAMVTLTATPAADSVFAGWSGDCSGTTTNCTVPMTAARNVTANFTLAAAPVSAPTSPSSSDWTRCATEGETCTFTGTRQVRYGQNTTWVTKTLTAPVACNNSTFGDPLVGVKKVCDYETNTTTSTTEPAPVTEPTPVSEPAPTTEPAPVTVPTSSTSGPIDSIIASMPSNSWKALPGTQMKDVCPAPYNSYACESVISAWSGGAYDTKRDRMVIYGGGHADSWYNNLFAFDLINMKWQRLTEMGAGGNGSAPGAGWSDPRLESCGFYPKGAVSLPDTAMNGNYVAFDKCFTEPVLSQLDLQQPRSSHTYGGVFVDSLGRYCSVGETYYVSAAGSPVSVCYDPNTSLWSRIANRPQGVGGRGQTAVASNGHIWMVAAEAGYIGEYDPSTNTWKKYGYNNYDAGGGTDIDRKRNQLYVLHPKSSGGYSVRRWDLNSPASLSATQTYTEVATSGTMPSNIGTRPGMSYADQRDMFFVWGGGRDIYTFNPATAAWTRLAATGDDPGAQQQWGTYGRFRYSPSRGVFVLVNGTTKDVYIYKP